VRNIAYEMLIYMEKKQIQFFTAIQKRSTKKVNNGERKVDNGRKVFEAGRLHERKLLIAVLQRERDRAQSL
jgi:hypothetical protein